MDEAQAFVPIQKDLLIRELKDEVILYDAATKRAHCLNRTAAAVWRLCDGQTNVTEIAQVLRQDERMVWMTLHELEESGVLNSEIPTAIRNNGLSRRELMTKFGIGAAVALPIVNSIPIPTASAAISSTVKQRQRRPRRSN